jgi:alpha-glucoside transport system ATP-binding protein
MTQLTLKNIEKSYKNGITVLKNVSLKIDSGELVVFVGPSGCGKSTLLRMIAGLEHITSGILEIDGQRMNDIPASKRGIAMVFQSYALYPHLTVHDNITFALKIAKYKQSEIDAAVDKVAKALQLTEYLHRLPKELSGGQRQRVAIGRAIVRNPKVFLFDEPLSNLDASLRVKTRIEIARLKESMPDRTMIYVTHDQVEAMTLATRIVVLAKNTVSQVGTPLDLYNTPENEFVAQFIGSPAMNLMPGTIVDTGMQTTVKLNDKCLAVSSIATNSKDMGKKVNVGIRPEHLRLTERSHLLKAEVEIIEALGEYTLLYVKHALQDENLIAKIPGTHKLLRNQLVKFSADPSKVHIFHKGLSMR